MLNTKKGKMAKFINCIYLVIFKKKVMSPEIQNWIVVLFPTMFYITTSELNII